ncbi:MAG TPA: MarR family transcriptional regulator, partial [Thermococcus sp.]|nr:MarR family transcriptional regulator [Thermococcus sp.]
MIYELNLRRVYEILRFVEQNEGATTNEIHKRLKISKASLLRYLRKLEQIGCIKRVEDEAV